MRRVGVCMPIIAAGCVEGHSISDNCIDMQRWRLWRWTERKMGRLGNKIKTEVERSEQAEMSFIHCGGCALSGGMGGSREACWAVRVWLAWGKVAVSLLPFERWQPLVERTGTGVRCRQEG